jgi:hypothetical protein
MVETTTTESTMSNKALGGVEWADNELREQGQRSRERARIDRLRRGEALDPAFTGYLVRRVAEIRARSAQR